MGSVDGADESSSTAGTGSAISMFAKELASIPAGRAVLDTTESDSGAVSTIVAATSSAVVGSGVHKVPEQYLYAFTAKSLYDVMQPSVENMLGGAYGSPRVVHLGEDSILTCSGGGCDLPLDELLVFLREVEGSDGTLTFRLGKQLDFVHRNISDWFNKAVPVVIACLSSAYVATGVFITHDWTGSSPCSDPADAMSHLIVVPIRYSQRRGGVQQTEYTNSILRAMPRPFDVTEAQSKIHVYCVTFGDKYWSYYLYGS